MFNLLNSYFSSYSNVSQSFNVELAIVEIIICYAIVLIFFEKNLFFVTLYVAFIFLVGGLVTCLFQAEVLVAFFWMGELTIIFIFIICIISIPHNSNLKKTFTFSSSLYTSSYIVGVYFLTVIFSNDPTNCVNKSTNYRNTKNDYYETLNNFFKTDLYGIFLAFYSENFVEFCILIFLILVCSILIVQFYSTINLLKVNPKSNMLSNLKFLIKYQFFFLKNQNLKKQSLKKSNYKFFNKR